MQMNRRTVLLGVAVLVAALGAPGDQPVRAVGTPALNIVLILTDDQTLDSLRYPSMPFLQGQLADPDDHWVVFENTIFNTPLCCPSRATLLTGQYSHQTGVHDNRDGKMLDEPRALPMWLDQAGYHSALVGRYLNGYPFKRGLYVPPGWDTWQGVVKDGYYNWTLAEGTALRAFGSTPADYQTDVLGERAAEVAATAPEPFFLWLAPFAPHQGWTPAPRHAGRFRSLPLHASPSQAEADVTDKPAWVRALPRGSVKTWQKRERKALETLLAMDDAVRGLFGSMEARGVLERTVVIFITDNGLSFGHHRWQGKRCIYEECIRTEMLIRSPGAAARTEPALVGNIDLAATIAEVAGVVPLLPQDGESLVPFLQGQSPPWRSESLLRWKGDIEPPEAFWGLRTDRYTYAELVTGEVELYDLWTDPHQLDNVAGRPEYTTTQAGLASRLDELKL